MADLMAVRMNGEGLEHSIYTCDCALMVLKTEQSEEVLRLLFLKQISGCSALREELAYFNRCTVSDANRTYDYLMRMRKRTLERKRQDNHRQQHARALAGEDSQRRPSAPGVDTSNGDATVIKNNLA